MLSMRERRSGTGYPVGVTRNARIPPPTPRLNQPVSHGVAGGCPGIPTEIGEPHLRESGEAILVDPVSEGEENHLPMPDRR